MDAVYMSVCLSLIHIYNGAGIGLNYHLGLFQQKFEDHLQKEVKNPWIQKKSWLKRTEVSYPVKFRGLTLQSRMYEILVTGYNNRTNKLQLFDVDSVDLSLIHILIGRSISFIWQRTP